MRERIDDYLKVGFDIEAKCVWTVEHTYTVYNRRRKALEIITSVCCRSSTH